VDKTPWLESWNVGAPGGSSAGGEDAGNMSAETKQMLTNCEVIAVDQDPEGAQGHRVWQKLEIWPR